MKVNVSFKNMESSPSLREYAVDKLENIVGKYVRGKVDGSVVLSVEKHRHIANFTLGIKDLTVKGKDESQDMYSSIDLALEKIEKQLRRHKDRIRDHQPTNGQARQFSMGVISPLGGSPSLEAEDDIDEEFVEDYERYPAPEEEEEGVEAEEVVETESGEHIRVLRNDAYEAKPMSVRDAVLQLELLDEREFFVFTNTENDALTIVYWRNDGNVGLIEA
jgi:putative sigma-54 modulation protein